MLKNISCVLLCLTVICTLVHAQVRSDVPQCKGIFDFYFVLDSSGSVRGHFQTEIVPFVRNVTVNFVSSSFRLSFVTFANQGIVHLNLTSNRESIAKGIESLESQSAGGGTYLGRGLQKVNEQIDKLGGDTASVILIITDGELTDQSIALQQANLARQKGASIFAIGIGSINLQQLNKLVNNKNEVFIGGNFEYLTTIIDQVVNDTCIEIISADPISVCTNQQDITVTLSGQGFTNSPNPNTTACRFLYNTTKFEITKPIGDIQDDTVVCRIPNFNISQEVLLQITLNGVSYISSNVTMYVSDCIAQPSNAGLATGLTFFFLALIILIILVLLWFFFPLITGKIVIPPAPTPQPEPEANPQPRKWAVVDASYYGGRGVGGIKPVTVRWGNKGATDEGNKLTMAKDANVLAKGIDVPPPRGAKQNQESLTCWGAIKMRLMSTYIKVSLIRPIRGSSKTIIWFPNCNAARKYQSSTATSPPTTSNLPNTSNTEKPLPTNENKSRTLPVHLAQNRSGATRPSPVNQVSYKLPRPTAPNTLPR